MAMLMTAMPIGLLLVRLMPLLSSTASLSVTLREALPGSAPLAPLTHHQQLRFYHAYGLAATALLFYALNIGAPLVNLSLCDGGLRLSPAGPTPDSFGAATQSSRLAASLYLAAAIFNAMHFAFAPRDIALLGWRLADGGGKVTEKDKKRIDNSTAMATDWAGLHVVRGLVADFPGMVCSFLAFLIAIT